MDVSSEWKSTDQSSVEWHKNLVPLISETIEKLAVVARRPSERFSFVSAHVYASTDVCTILENSPEFVTNARLDQLDIASLPRGSFVDRKFALHADKILINDIRIILQLRSGTGQMTMFGNIRILD